MPEPLPDPRIRRALDQVDQLKEELRAECIRASNLKTRLEKAQRIAAAAKQRPEQRAG